MKPIAVHILLAGIALLASSAAPGQEPVAPPAPTLDVRRYIVDGPVPLSAQAVQEALVPHLGDRRTLPQIEAAAQALELRLRAAGYPFHRVLVPAQRPEHGEVRLEVVPIRLGQVEVSGNRHFGEATLRAGLPALQEGQPPALSALGTQLAVGNGNPARQLAVTFRESRQPGTVDAVVRVRDQPPQAFIVSSTANIGGRGSSGDVWRLVGTWQHANLWDREHVATVSWGTDPRHVSRVRLFAAHYQVPLPAQSLSVAAFFTHSDVDFGRVPFGGAYFDVSGSGRFMGLRLTRALGRVGSLEPSLAMGIEDRLFRNQTRFIDEQLNPDVASRVLSLQATTRSQSSWGAWSASLDWAANIGGGRANRQADHVANGGERSWRMLRWSVEAALPAGAWQVLARSRGQHSGSQLISGEQFGIGGSQSVRGFSDRAATGERGALLNLEVLGFPWGDTGARPVFFVDVGRVRPRTSEPDALAAAGVGLRWAQPDWQVTLDLAQVLQHRVSPEERGDRRLHLAVVARF